MKFESELKKEYHTKIIKEIAKELNLKNEMAVPTIQKIVVNSGVGEAKNTPQLLDDMAKDLASITGQKAMVAKSKEAISNFKIRLGLPIGLKVTLRGIRMWFFLEKLIHIVLPRVKDFRGLSNKGFDGKGAYSFGFKDQLVFPEIDPIKTPREHGLQVTIVTNARNPKETKLLLTKLGVPFAKGNK